MNESVNKSCANESVAAGRRARGARAIARQATWATIPGLPPGFCLNCGHHEGAHLRGDAPRFCETEVSDYGETDCQCPGLRLCAACEGDPEAHGLHVCGRTA